ncbi:MAG: ABC transporter substrate-binding protein, partial [Anaerolineales bacterium]
MLVACNSQPAPFPSRTATAAPPDPRATEAATSTPPPTPTATPVPIELVVCQRDEPTSLYQYGDDTSARAGIFDALFDGPIESAGYAYQPTILETLPSLENGGGTLAEVMVNPGDRVVDAATGAVVPLAEGVQLAQVDGSRLPYTGTEPARTVQVSAEFVLQPDLLWSDGHVLTAADSLFSFEIASSPDTPVSKYVVERTARYEVIDELATRWTGLPGWLDPNFVLRFWTPLPRHLFGAHSAAQLLTNRDVAERPLGWGPFMVGPQGWAKGEHLTLVRNPNYFRAGEGLPRVDQLTFRFGLSAEQIVAEMLAGRCDIGAEQADFSGQMEALLRAQQAGTLTPQFVPDTSFEHLDFGIQPAEGYTRSAGNDLFNDARVRQAIAYCLDRQALVDQLLHGQSETPAVYLPSTHPLYAADAVTVYPFDPARGQALLEEAGWADRDGDGLREAGAGGRKLSVEYASGPSGSAFREALMQVVQAQLRDHCGVEVRPKLYALEELYAPWPSGVLFGRKFDLGQFPWRTGIEPPCELYLTEAIPSDQNPGGANNTGYSNPAFDQACLAAKSALAQDVRQARHAEAQAIFTQDLPSLPLFQRLKIGVARPGVSGYRL